MSRGDFLSALTDPFDDTRDNRPQIQAQWRLLQAVMKTELSARQRDAFWRYVGQGQSQKEIARHWGVHPSVVCRHIAKAQRRLLQIAAYTTYESRARTSCQDL